MPVFMLKVLKVCIKKIIVQNLSIIIKPNFLTWQLLQKDYHSHRYF